MTKRLMTGCTDDGERKRSKVVFSYRLHAFVCWNKNNKIMAGGVMAMSERVHIGRGERELENFQSLLRGFYSLVRTIGHQREDFFCSQFSYLFAFILDYLLLSQISKHYGGAQRLVSVEVAERACLILCVVLANVRHCDLWSPLGYFPPCRSI